ncbi:TadE/TadG family type IV pilus assembly protein [Methylobacter sp. YRD-M1]|uniref:TadE/TadG family type IV pilus assembly protein n=1 Tax=Methylobacter sp. YRD-M1 TaxID=2911520 RepID=UPI00227C1E1C|nr:TadE family protein [Methylobacter sp. YRD-M1]WAK03627.1 pilus assembly protein [Methylobacter sp. YRD-M1]
MKPRASQPRAETRYRLSCSLRKQRGAAAIEAALLFVIFFTLFYAIVSYSMPILMMQAFNHAASAGARAAVAIDPATDNYDAAVESRVRAVVGDLLNWLPSAAHSAVLGDGNKNVQVDFDQPSAGMLTVTVSFPNYTDKPLIPILKFPGIGDVPNLPKNLSARAAVQL